MSPVTHGGIKQGPEGLFPTLSAHRFTESIAGAWSTSCHMLFHLAIHANSGNSLFPV